MTHTLNRRGISDERPGEEIVVLCMAHCTEKANKADAMRSIAATILKYRPSNYLGKPLGLEPEGLQMMAPVAGVVTAVFNNKEDVRRLIGDLKEQKLGVSVVLSGLFSDVRDICGSNGLNEHTYHMSLGIFGKTECLPDEKTLEITTQCGHSLISPALVADVVRKMKRAKITAAEGAALLVKPCACGIGNPERIERIVQEMVTEGGKA
ncbi:MAG: hypothetical protein C4520_19440 [Candidatus Abyssobacteria bacterium SURF_5]|uniref:Uncharacterized protein n=1 Tax=Abyssobacteria bacterium (strain SURF_5) TaxID=2093360 RepID=A0A3A4N9U9_ABYX5|nr:MAG: hypothetical protein C4520_19440 [Candidatus Abyssubacteria bacterium SURF_5]